jgi:hypothetical protein
MVTSELHRSMSMSIEVLVSRGIDLREESISPACLDMVSMLDSTGHKDHSVGHLLHSKLLQTLQSWGRMVQSQQRGVEEGEGGLTVTAPEAESPRPVALFPPTVLSPTLPVAH